MQESPGTRVNGDILGSSEPKGRNTATGHKMSAVPEGRRRWDLP